MYLRNPKENQSYHRFTLHSNQYSHSLSVYVSSAYLVVLSIAIKHCVCFTWLLQRIGERCCNGILPSVVRWGGSPRTLTDGRIDPIHVGVASRLYLISRQAGIRQNSTLTSMRRDCFSNVVDNCGLSDLIHWLLQMQLHSKNWKQIALAC